MDTREVIVPIAELHNLKNKVFIKKKHQRKGQQIYETWKCPIRQDSFIQHFQRKELQKGSVLEMEINLV